MLKSKRPELIAVVALLAASSSALAQAVRDRTPDESEAFFRAGPLPRLVIELEPEAEEALRAEPRSWALGRLREGDKAVFPDISVKLKGAAGSFREYDDTPSFTIRMDRNRETQTFHALRKFHLNKSVQDATYLRELLGSEICRAAGIPTPRVGHALVRVNDRELGIFVVKEGFDEVFLRRHFDKADGNLYDGGFCQDLDAPLEKDEGNERDSRPDLEALHALCVEPDLVKRWAGLEKRVDIKGFVGFMAIELMLGHWDGYCQNRNNYRLYFDPKSGRAVFMTHGMDQVLQDAGASILDNPVALLADAVMKNPAWRAEYRRRVAELLPLFTAEKLKRRVEEVDRRLRPALEGWNREAAAEHERAVGELKSILEEREKSLREQKSMPDPKPLVFPAGKPVRITRPRSASESEDATVEAKDDDGVAILRIACGKSGSCVASWRRGVLLGRGKYRFQAQLACRDVVALEEEGAPGRGGGLRISGGTREGGLLGTAGFKPIDYEFEVKEEARDVELIIELRASGGELRIRADSMFLLKVK